MLHQFFKFSHNKPTKTDKKDSQTIADFLQLQQNELKDGYFKPDPRISVRHFVREKERITHEIARTKTYIRMLLTLLFPEIERRSGIFSNTILQILLHFGGASTIRAIPKEQFIAQTLHLPPLNGQGRKPSISPEEIYQLASSSIAGDWPEYQQLLKMKIKRLYHLMEEKDNITKLIQDKTEKFFKREIEILCSIPGIGKDCATYFLAEIIDIKRFKSPKNLVGFCGLDPVLKQSGKFSASLRISKRGNAHARRIVWIMAGSVKRNCNYFRDYYLKKRNEGKSYKEAVIATATKLLRTIHALLNQNRCFM